MNCLIVYSTLSGSTMTAAGVINDALNANGVQSALAMADPSVKDQIAKADAIVFASPSWEDNGLDGQPLPEVRQLLESLTSADLSGKKVAVAGLGDTSYPHFCGAVTVLEGLLKDRGVTPIAEALKIDRYYSSPDNEQKTKDWAANLAKTIAA